MKRPSFQFYPGDWLNDAALRMVSVGARGLWIEMICLMHQGSEYGYLKVNHKVILTPNLARMVGATLTEVEGWLVELEHAGVFSVDQDGCIYSRRMIRDEEVRQARAAGGKLGGNPNLLGSQKVDSKVNLMPNLNPTPSSSSSSSSSSISKEIKDTKAEPSKKITLDVFVRQREEMGIMPIDEKDPVWGVIDALGMPDDFAVLQWRCLEQQYSQKKGGTAKRYVDWSQILARALRELWGNLFFKHETQGWILTSKGKNLKELAA